jgi:hypothetical protein
LDGDGKIDMLIANADTGKVAVLLGKGNGQFASPVEYSVGKQPSSVVIGDFNGDGKPDVAVANQGDGTVSVLLGNGDGTLQKATTYAAVADAVYLTAGDFNGDGKLDLAVAGSQARTIAVLINDGAGGFLKAVPYHIGHAPRALALADFGGTGHLDIASANADGTVSLLTTRGDGTFRMSESLRVGTAALSSITSADFNADGKADLAVTEAGSKVLTVLLGKGNGSFETGAHYSVGSIPSFIVTSDVNNDNIPDLVTANPSGNSISVSLGNGDGSFKPSLDYTAGSYPVALAVGDFDADGKPDLAIVNYKDKSVSVALGRGDGTFKAARAYTTDLERKSVATGDLDGDGRSDLVVTNFCGASSACNSNGTVSILLGDGHGVYKLGDSYPLGLGPLSVTLADVNGDKKLDILAVNRGDKTVSVMLGNGDGTFQPAVTYPVVGSPVSLAVGDFNKDGKPDLAIATDCGANTCTQVGELNLLLGNGDGSFQAGIAYPVGYSPSSVVAGDLNGDKNLDLLVANACGSEPACVHGTATVLIGDGEGNFKLKADVPLGKNPSSIAVADLHGSGKLDLIVAHRGENNVAVVQGMGNGTFKAAVTYPVGSSPSSVVAADFNGDGKTDVAVANFDNSTVSVLFGNGDGSLQKAVPYSVGAGPESLVAIGSKSKSHADLVSANGNAGVQPMGGDVTVLQNLADTTGTAISTTVIVLTSGNNPSTYGDTLAFTATVTGDGVSGTPTGTVDFTDNGASIDPNCDTVTLTAVDSNTATAVCTTTLLTAGTHPLIVATYSGDTTYAGSSGTLTPAQVVNVATTTTSVALTTGTTPAIYGTTLTFTATVTPQIANAPTGTVTFSDNGTPINGCTATMVTQGTNQSTAACTPANLTVAGSPHQITAVYSGDSNFTGSDNTANPLVQVITQATTTTSVALTVGTTPAVYGTLLTFTATVLPQISGSPTGTATFSDNGTAIPGCINQGLVTGNDQSTATCQVSTITVPGSPHNITAVYNDDSNFTGSTSSPIQQVMTQASTTTTVALTVGTPTATYGTALTFTATVTPQISGSPTGTVTFSDNGAALPTCTGVSLTQLTNQSTAACQIATLTVAGSPHNITARYNDDPNFTGSDSTANPLLEIITQAASQTSVALTQGTPTAPYGTPLVFTATVTPQISQSPTGTITFFDNGVAIPICTAITLTQGNNQSTGVCAISTLDVAGSPHNITANYSGDGNFGASSASPIQEFITAASTTTVVALTTGTTPAIYGTALTFTATVFPQFTGAPSGTVAFMDGTTVIPSCPAQILTQGNNQSTATCLVSNLTVAGSPHHISAVYSGDNNNFLASASSPILQAITPATTRTSVALTLGTTPAVYGTTLNFTATVTPQISGAPTGTVTFFDGGTPIPACLAVALTQGNNQSTAICMDASLSVSGSPHNITVRYNADGNFTASTSTAIQQTITQATSQTVVSPSNENPSVYGQPVTFVATVTPQISQAPTGIVNFFDNGVLIGVCTGVPLIQGNNLSTATCQIATLTVAGSPHNISAIYSGDGNFIASVGTAIQQIVTQATPLTTLTTSITPSISGQAVVLSATVVAPFGGQPTGTVTFTSNSGAIAECPGPVALINGQASCTTSTLGSGLDTVQATYNGDGNFTAAMGMLTQIVEDFTVSLNTPTLRVIQGFTNTGQPAFNGYPQQVTFTAAPVPRSEFSGQVNVTCTVTALSAQNVQNPPTCTPNQSTFTGGGGSVTYTISVGAATTLGTYTVSSNAVFNYGTSGVLQHTSSLVLTVVQYAAPITVVSSGNGTTGNNPDVTFTGPADTSVTFSCDSVINQSTGAVVSPASIFITCDFSPPSTTLSATVSMTIHASTTSIANMLSPSSLFSAVSLGLPAMVLMGSLPGRKRSRKRMLQFLGLLLVLAGMLQGIGCGGGFTAPVVTSNQTPSGNYLVLAVGKDNQGNVQTSAVVPLTVGQ